MEIHKPKPWHGLREFLKEYVIIVVGVLTALAFEQAAEWMHWRHLADEAEHDLAAGLKFDLINSITWMARDPCDETRLAELSTALRAAGPQWRGYPMALIENPMGHSRVMPIVMPTPNPLWSHDPWETAVASGVLAHMPRDRVAHYGTAYRLVDLARNWQFQSVVESQKLSALGFDGQVSPAEKAGYLNELAQIEQLQSGVATNARSIFRHANALGVQLTQAEVDQRTTTLRTRLGSCVADVKLPVT